ncbi:hypothetical protein [Streptacidiphilus fuscans]|uniref:Uncharacterized protein n=1 Tax=Streptacidiphilus fuscans TaxID=2789292 RepID=A0A931B4Z6_9ACTN|nr:hypothetical protein [Streptacidiphilus fuscans]MBF9069091.1 hypothetical protein [Streptacidiphilus fuscans]
MKVHLTRDSVAMGDDADAPHGATRDLPAEMSAGEAITSVVKSDYLASIAGGKASWVLTCAGSSIAVVAQQWERPRFITPQGVSLSSLAVEDGSIHWHFRYLAQRDPGVIFEELKAASAT